jgi:hypothetical protein
MVSEKPFILTDYEKLIDPQNHVERITLNENNTFSYLEALGYDNSDLYSGKTVCIRFHLHNFLSPQ